MEGLILSLLPLFVPVPDDRAELQGYQGQFRYVAFFCSEEANEVIVTDGACRCAGKSLRFLEYAGHPSVECELGDIDIGLFGHSATAWLVLDRQTRYLYYAPARTSRHGSPLACSEVRRK